MSLRAMEGSTPRFWATLRDEMGALIQASSLTSLSLTLYDVATKRILNSRDSQNVLNINNVTVYNSLQSGTDEDGKSITYNLLWQLQPLDTAIVRPGKAVEVHAAEFVWTWDSGARRGVHREYLQVANVEAIS